LFTVRGGDAGGGDRAQQILDFVRRHVARRAVAERCHHVARRDAATSAVSLAWLGEDAPVVAQRRGLGALHVLEPAQVLASEYRRRSSPKR
jgi:hypothetical protein